MPRVRNNWKKYTKQRIRDFVINNLDHNGMKQYELADAMGKNRNTFYHQMKSVNFDCLELIEIFDIFNTPLEERAKLLQPTVKI